MNADPLAELVLTFFTGLSMEHNLSSRRASIVRKIDDLNEHSPGTVTNHCESVHLTFRWTDVRSDYARVVHKDVEMSELGGDGSDGGVVVWVNGEVADVKTFGLESRCRFFREYFVVLIADLG